MEIHIERAENGKRQEQNGKRTEFLDPHPHPKKRSDKEYDRKMQGKERKRLEG